MSTTEDDGVLIVLSGEDADGDGLSFAIDSPPSSGTLSVPTAPDCDGGTPQICTAEVTYTPDLDTNGTDSFDFAVDDGNEGPTTATVDITVDSVNDAPMGTDKTVATDEDVSYVFTTGDFGFSDPVEGDSLAGVIITTGPAEGSLTNNGTGFADGTLIPESDIAGGKLEFTPALNAHNAGYGSFAFQVKDDGGVLNGGIAVDPTQRTMTIDVASVIDAPSGANNTVNTPEDDDYVFDVADFGFIDGDGDNLVAVTITTLPGVGTLEDDGSAVSTLGQVSEADITAGKLTFTPAANANGAPYTTFTFQVQDDGLTDNLDASPNTMRIDVDGVHDAPVGTSTAIGITENASHTFTTGDFGFTDPSDSPADAFSAVKISTLPGAGTFTNNGTAISLGAVIPVGDIGLVVFTPAAATTGSPYASFTFQVQDDGGANDLDLTPRMITINVAPINHAPAGADKTITILEDAPYTFAALDFGFTDAIDSNPLLAVKITTLATAGTVLNNGVAVPIGNSVTAVDIAANKLTFAPAANASGTGYASFTFQVQDNGGTASGGVDLDESANSFTINVTARNDAPSGVSKTVGFSEDTSYTFGSTDFDFSDTSDSPSNGFTAVKVTTLPTSGSLKDNLVGVTLGQVIPIVDITGGKLVFTPASNGNGSPYATFTFQVQDDGGVLNSGADLDPTPRTMSANVAPVNDNPIAHTDISLTVPEGAGPTALAVLANDTDVDGDALFISSFTAPAHGVVAVTGGGTGLTYDPTQLYYGPDTFKYTIDDHHGGTLSQTTVTLTVVKDTAAPTLGLVVQSFYSQTVGSSTAKARISWSGSDAGTGIAGYTVQQSYQSGAWTAVALSSATSTSVTRTVTDQKSYRFRVRATDKNGNVSAWVYGPTFKPGRYQNTSSSIAYSGAWTTKSNSKALAGSHRYTSSASARASVTTSTQDFGLVMTKSSSSGSVQVWIDGVLASTLNLKKSTTAYRGLVFSRHFTSLGTHKIELRPVGNGRVYLDAILILR